MHSACKAAQPRSHALGRGYKAGFCEGIRPSRHLPRDLRPQTIPNPNLDLRLPVQKITSTDDIMVYQAESAAESWPISSLAARRKLPKMAELSTQAAGAGGDATGWQQLLQPAQAVENVKDNKNGYHSPNCTTPPPLNID